MIERIESSGKLLGLIIRRQHGKPGITFFTPSELSQQLAYMHHPTGKVIEPHVHNPMPRQVVMTQETLLIRRGKLRVDFFDETPQLRNELNPGSGRCDFARARRTRF